MKHLICDFDGTIADSFDETLAVFNLITKRPSPPTALPTSTRFSALTH
jgi:hypothetical protein